ncbi:hypothetical protein ciss_20390 [Carboxydothermus islandicus]|uniref:TIGR04086 family membrane protein n=1 Tax=Carboxydothermus islandicus TaxID=661089 RepID=A0A1L8D4H8_9THEO|nr:TIGR04086 family membrane protein [Carboxydothermus islandicus]GAV26106.1 hypothetical protein ciss_20390 [Carboxydothermus islandicus]
MNLQAVFWGTIIALGTLLFTGTIFAVIFYYFITNFAWWTALSFAILFISLLAGGFAASRRAQKKGLWHGLLLGIIFIIIFLIASAVLFHTPFSWVSFFEKSLIILLAGAIGGILGVSIL